MHIAAIQMSRPFMQRSSMKASASAFSSWAKSAKGLNGLGRASERPYLQFDQSNGRNANHHWQDVGVGVLLQSGAEVHHVIGHWCCLALDGHRNPEAGQKNDR